MRVVAKPILSFRLGMFQISYLKHRGETGTGARLSGLTKQKTRGERNTKPVHRFRGQIMQQMHKFLKLELQGRLTWFRRGRMRAR